MRQAMLTTFVFALLLLVGVAVAIGAVRSGAYRSAVRRIEEAHRIVLTSGDDDAALAAARSAYELVTAPPLAGRPDTRELREAATLLLAAQLLELGYAREVLQRLDEIEIAGHADRSRDNQLGLLVVKAGALACTGAFAEAAGYSETAVRVVREDPVLRNAETGEQRDFVAAALHCHALNSYHLGAVDEAVALVDDVVMMLPVAPETTGMLCRYLADRATFDLTTGRAERAESAASEAVKLGRDAEPSGVNRQHLVLALYAFAGCLVQLDRADEAVPLAAEAVVMARAHGDRHPFPRLLLATCLTAYAHALHRAGRTVEAADLISEAEPLHRQAAAKEPAANAEELAFTLRVKAEIAAAQGRMGDARQYCAEAGELFQGCAAGRPERFRYAIADLDELRRTL